MHKIKRSIHNCLLVALAVFAAVPAWAAVELRIDRDHVMVGETVTLSFVTNDSSQSLETDFSVLEDDFDILDRRSETQLSIVNNRQTAVVRLLLTVEPLHDGDIQIPSFQFGKERTEPATLRVDPAPELAPGELPPVFIEVELTPGEGPYYVHAQFGLVVRILYKLNLTEATISQPNPSPASVRLLQETPYQAERGGERYRVLERHYAIFPERSGELVIPPLELSGRLVERRANSIWQPTVHGRRVKERSEELHLLIEPKPASFTGDGWQPARDFKVSQQVSAADALRVGEPVTRTILVDAVGLEENMILEPAWPELEGARIYPDQPQGITRDDGRWVLGHKEFRYAVVPERAGELLLPELKIDWWDTRNNVQRTAVVQAHSLQVEASALVPSPRDVLPAEPLPAEDSAASIDSPADTNGTAWKWVALVLAVLWLATLILAWRLGRSNGTADNGKGKNGTVDAKEAALLRVLKQACNSGDAEAARRRLQRWLRRYGPSGEASLLEFAAETGDEALCEAVYTLDACGYRDGPAETWEGRQFWRRFEDWRKRVRESDGKSRAPATDLYAKENRVLPAN